MRINLASFTLFICGVICSVLRSEQFHLDVIPAIYPAASSVQATIDAGFFGSPTDESAISGHAVLDIQSVGGPTDRGQVTALELVLDDGMEFSLAFNAVQGSVAPGDLTMTLITPGAAGSILNGQFDQLANTVALSGFVNLSTEPEPIDLSTFDPMLVDFLGIQVDRTPDQLEMSLQVNLEIEMIVDDIPILGSVPVTISIDGAGRAVTAITSSPGDFDGDGLLTTEDIDRLAEAFRTQNPDPVFDVNTDGKLDASDHRFWIEILRNTYVGDTNLDGEFNSSDFIAVFQAGQYEDDVALNSTWATGDWNGDAEFDSADFVAAFRTGGYELGPRTGVRSVPEPRPLGLVATTFAIFALKKRKHNGMCQR
ncbi:MAG: hypothetical protein R3C28_23325 [Pirellulaceae bacterium]